MQENHPSRRLVLVRHAEAAQSAGSDIERALTERGVADAAAAGYWLGAQGVTATAALVSAATRAQLTFEALSRAAGWTVPAEPDRAVYSGEPETVLDLIRLADPATATLAVVGHNPTVESLAQLLDDGEGDQDAVLGMLGGFVAGSVAVFEVAEEWAELGWGGARLCAFRRGG
ncbi:MAG: histidine phosphatase family protein [Nocardioides sp.]